MVARSLNLCWSRVNWHLLRLSQDSFLTVKVSYVQQEITVVINSSCLAYQPEHLCVRRDIYHLAYSLAKSESALFSRCSSKDTTPSLAILNLAVDNLSLGVILRIGDIMKRNTYSNTSS